MSKRGLGQLCCEVFGGEVAVLRCGTHTGTVAAARNWDGDMEIVVVLPSRPDSCERQAHDTGLRSFVLNSREASKNDESLKKELMKQKLETFIGVTYKPGTELRSHHSSAVLGKQLDAYKWFDESHVVQALEKTQPRTPLAQGETYPFEL